MHGILEAIDLIALGYLWLTGHGYLCLFPILNEHYAALVFRWPSPEVP